MMSPVPGNHRTSLTMFVLLCSAVLSSILCLVGAHSDQCGTSAVTLVTRGRPITKGEYPWLAALYNLDEEGNWTQFCGGALLSPRIILTAAHCLASERIVTEPEKIKVGLGKLYRDFYHDEDYAIIANVSQIVVHEGYHGSRSTFALDVGLLKLSIPVQMTDYILPVCFDRNITASIGTGAIVHAAGWGTSENGTSTDRALAADLSYMDYHACLIRIREVYRRYVTHEKICSLSTIHGSQVDRGDSGGPLTFYNDGRHFIVGVVSTKIMDQTSFSIFTDLSKPEIHSWLMEKTNLNSPDKYPIVASSRSGYKVRVINSTEFVVTRMSDDINLFGNYYEHLIVISQATSYIAHVRNSKEFAVTIIPDYFGGKPAVDCVTGTFYYAPLNLRMIKRQTVNGTDIKRIIKRGGEVTINVIALDWIDRKLYWIEQHFYVDERHIFKKVIGDYRLMAASLNTWIVETKIPHLPESLHNPRHLTIHPTLRKLYILTGDFAMTYSVDLDISTSEPTLFHEVVGGSMIDIAIDWETNDLCWLFIPSYSYGKIECKNIVTKTIRTVFSEVRWPSDSRALAISSQSYYWSNDRMISVMSKSSYTEEIFTYTDNVNSLNILREPCPTLTPAPRHSTTRQS